MSNFTAMNEIYATYFGDEPPARSTVAVAELPKGAQVEIEAIAVRNA
jgi:2-iminobutanoate/2-iminopropanoate deaminase